MAKKIPTYKTNKTKQGIKQYIVSYCGRRMIYYSEKQANKAYNSLL